jgi:hypothetical protein
LEAKFNSSEAKCCPTIKCSEAKYGPQKAAQNREASDRPPKGRLNL